MRDALVAKAQANDPLVTNCSQVGDDDGIDELAGIAGPLDLSGQGIAALKPGDFAGLSGVTRVTLSSNALSALPAGVFDGLGAVTILDLRFNALGAGSLRGRGIRAADPAVDAPPEHQPRQRELRAEGGCREDLVLRAGESATLGGPGTGRDPWGMNVDYAWVEVDAEGNPVADAERTEGLSATDVASPGFTAPALAAERVLRYRLTVQGRGRKRVATSTATRASDTVTVTVRAAPAVTAVALTSVPQADGEYRRGETIEVSVTFSAPVTVTGPPAMPDDRARGGDGGAAGGLYAQRRSGGAAVLLHRNRRRQGRRRGRGAGKRHPARGRDHCGVPRGAIARPRCGGGGPGAHGRRLGMRR